MVVTMQHLLRQNLYLLLVLSLPLPSLADGAALVEENCAGCHALTPAGENAGIAERGQRAAPPLHYAGNKFRETWLVAWLQQPARIRPAGYYPPDHVTVTDDGDVIDESSLPDHPVLGADDAVAATAYLMTLRAGDALIDADSYEPGTVALRMGMMDFRRFKGCNACHQDAVDDGGLSGPMLYDAWNRLQPAFMSSYIQDPTAWDPHSLMPVPNMNEAAVHKLVHYLKAIGEQ